jgi:signal recognition particle GTPase
MEAFRRPRPDGCAIPGTVSRSIDVALLDTAGRLHTNAGLMEELRKVKRAGRLPDVWGTA